MAAKPYKPKVDKKRYIFPIIIGVALIVLFSYLGFKINKLLYKNQSWLDSSWFDYFPFLSDYLQPRVQIHTQTIFQRNFYTSLFSSVWEDVQFVGDHIHNIAVCLLELFSSVLALFSLVVLVCVCLTVSLYKDTRGTKGRRKQGVGKKTKDKTGVAAKNGHVCCEHETENKKSSKLYWKWFTLLVFLAMLLSIPWEFVRMYQSMVAEKVAQMEAGVPAECLPDQTVVQSMKSYLRWYLSWAPDPCLVYHKALIVDPVWQVPPLMVLSSAFSHCIVYPIEVLFGGLGRAFKLFFQEIPAPWQPFMLVVIVIVLVLILIMAFGYRIHLPLLLKFEPRTPIDQRYKSRREYIVKKEKQNLQFSPTESQQSIESSQETQFSQDTQSTQESQDFD